MKNSSEYYGSESLTIRYGTTLPITHIGSTNSIASNSEFIFDETLCVPKEAKNLILISKFCDYNSTFIEFYPSYFVMKDLHSKRQLARWQIKDWVYEPEMKKWSYKLEP